MCIINHTMVLFSVISWSKSGLDRFGKFHISTKLPYLITRFFCIIIVSSLCYLLLLNLPKCNSLTLNEIKVIDDQIIEEYRLTKLAISLTILAMVG